MTNLLRFVVSIALITAVGGCSNEPSAGMVINHIGAPAPAAIQIAPGKCGEIKTIQSDKKELVTIRECGGPVGTIKITVRCSDPGLPEAVISRDFPSGDSHYVAFHDVCSSTKEQIEKGNVAKRMEHAWRPVK
jgi:hypothetical protein